MWKGSSGRAAVNWCLKCVSLCSPIKLREGGWPEPRKELASRKKGDQL